MIFYFLGFGGGGVFTVVGTDFVFILVLIGRNSLGIFY